MTDLQKVLGEGWRGGQVDTGRDARGSSTGMAASISAPCRGDNGDKAVQDRVRSPKRPLVVCCRSHSRFLVLFFSLCTAACSPGTSL